MDGFEEKKWFVYLGDHHEGPFSLGEIEAKLQEAQVSASSYVWSDGMADWAVMKEVPVFSGLLARQKNAVFAPVSNEERTPSLSLDIETDTPERKKAESPEGEPVFEMQSNDSPSFDLNKRHLLRDPSKRPDLPHTVAKKRGGFGLILKMAVLALILGGVGYGFQAGYLSPETPAVRSALQSAQGLIAPLATSYSKQFPVLLDLISPFSSSPELGRDELRELKAAAISPIQSGPSLAMAVSGAGAAPVLYVATNLPNGARFDLHLEGVPETLLNRYRAKVDSAITVQDHLGKTDSLKLDGNTPLPTGEYQIQIGESSNQLSIRKTVFIGGSKDAAYEAKLKEFHAKVREKSMLELTEIKQIFSAIESGLGLTNQRYEEARKSTAARKRVWPKFRREWQTTAASMTETFTKWGTSLAAGDLYFDSLYRETQQAGEALIRLNSLQGEMLDGKGDRKSLEIQLGEATSVAQSAVQSLKTRIELVEKNATENNGLPKKEGP